MIAEPSISLIVTGPFVETTCALFKAAIKSEVFDSIVYVSNESHFASKLSYSMHSSVKTIFVPLLDSVAVFGSKSGKLKLFAHNVYNGCLQTSSDRILRIRSDLVLSPEFFIALQSICSLYNNKVLICKHNILVEPFVGSDYLHLACREIMVKAFSQIIDDFSLYKLFLSSQTQGWLYPRLNPFISETAVTLSLIYAALGLKSSQLNWSNYNQWNYYRRLVFHEVRLPSVAVPFRLRPRRGYNIKMLIISRFYQLVNNLRGI